MFEEFEAIEKITIKKGFSSKNEAKPKLSPKRIGRITGSSYDKINFESYRHEKGSKATKQDMIDWILSKNGDHLLHKACKKAGVELNKQLKVPQIKEVYLDIPPNRRMTKGTESYLIKLLSYHTCKSAEERYSFESKATNHGNDNEPEAIDCFEKWFLNMYGHDVEFCKSPEFGINPDNCFLGSTPDVTIRFLNDKEITFIAEAKCPKNPANHAFKFYKKAIGLAPKDQLDPRYKKQRLGYFINFPSIEAVYFFSYETDPKEDRFRIHVVEMLREDYKEEIEELRKDLYVFTEIYKDVMDKMEIDYSYLYE